MRRYSNIHGASGVEAFEITADGIRVRFRTGDVYAYTAASAGRAAVIRMTQLAKQGKGLSTYISRHNPRYSNRMAGDGAV